ncbi:hypothetical protein [Endozoicomonas sp. 4G]|uniref:hypothetical protein n=1 Tax=Endozoicomonas sp. 4G TaxID=2872754 RepID=UPI00207907E0|nr:hypothetical protein [Endozoicomonas sp. 4G]
MTLAQSGDSDSHPVSIESLLHNEANDEAGDFANGHAIASLLSDVIINHTVALIQSPNSAPASIPVSQVAGKVEFTADGHSGQLPLCGEQQPDCDSHLQLTYKLFPYPHFGMTLQGQHDIKSNVDATLAQLANANRAELMLQLLEKATLHFFMASVQQKQEEVSPETAIVPSPHKFVTALQPAVKALMPERGIWKSERLNNVLPMLWGLHPSLFKSFMMEPEASLTRPLKRLKTSQGANTAILTEKHVELIKKLVDGRVYELTKDQFIEIISYIPLKSRGAYVPKTYLTDPIFTKEFFKNGILLQDEIEKNKLTKDILLTRSKNKFLRIHYNDLPDELKNDVKSLIEYSKIHGIPNGISEALAVYIYGHLDIAEKLISLNAFPDSFKNGNDDLYDELIRSGMIKLKDLPEDIKIKNKEYCLSQLSQGLTKLSEVPIQFITKEIILDSFNSQHWYSNFISIFSKRHNYDHFNKDPVFFEEILIKAVTTELETNHKSDENYRQSLFKAYDLASERYEEDEEKLGLLLEKLVKANPFLLAYIENLNDRLLQKLIETAKTSFLDILKNRPEVSRGFDITFLYSFFEAINADNEFKTYVLNIIYRYFPDPGIEMLPEVILEKLDRMVSNSEPFDKGHNYILIRKLEPGNPHTLINYIEKHREFLYFFKNKEYFENHFSNPTVRQRLILTLAQRLVTNKEDALLYWQYYLPQKLLDDTLDFLKDPALFYKLDSSDKLAEPVNPLNFQLPNTSLFEFMVALKAPVSNPGGGDSVAQLQSEFAHAGGTVFQPVYPDQHSLSLFKEKGTVVGGRTLAVPNPNGKEVDYYKFIRVGESEATLAQEGIMHQFIAKSDRFKSRKPRFGQYLVVLEKDLPESTRGFTDRLKVSFVNGEPDYRVYHFTATDDYSQYAHRPDETRTPYAAGERGLLNGIHDIGVLNGQFGIMPTSTIPAFHATGRRWVFLSPLLGNSDYYAFPLPGDFENWIEAIERPDFGWDGLRDWGDVEFYGSMKSGLSAQDSKAWGYTPEVFQRLSFANALCENLLAAVLLRSRLRRDSPDYHYKDKQAVAETENFIEQLLNEYLSGLFAKEKELQPKPRLQALMQLDDSKYRSWLTRTAQEILYWTARQPYEVTDPCASTPSGECYSQHLQLTGHLDKILYPELLHPLDKQKQFPRDFLHTSGHLNLGASNAVFPLVALVRGLTRVAAHIFAYLGQYISDQETPP